MPLIPDDSSPVSHHSLASPPDRFVSRSTPASAVHSREASSATTRGRALDPSALNTSSLQPKNNRRGQSHSKSPETSGPSRPNLGYDAGLERRPSNSSYGHHRQTSIVHGIQHSRNPSFAASSTSNSPLSPELIASLGRGGGISSGTSAHDQEPPSFGRLEQPDMQSTYQSPGANGSSHGLQGSSEDQGVPSIVNGSPASHMHRRMNSNGRTWQDRSHSRSHSRHYIELRTVGEYALHHLFNSVRYTSPFVEKDMNFANSGQFVGQADNKINQAILKLGELEAPVEEVCGPGVDPTFDQLISALGHISRQKPKPLIDTIMFWRKAKGDAAITARHVANQVCNEQVEQNHHPPPYLIHSCTTSQSPHPQSLLHCSDEILNLSRWLPNKHKLLYLIRPPLLPFYPDKKMLTWLSDAPRCRFTSCAES